MFKQCKDCGEVKTLDLFPKNRSMSDGHVNSCKVCTCLYEKQRRHNYPEIFKRYEEKRSKLPHRILLNTTIGKRYITDNPERYKATNTVNNALRDGKIQKLPCFCCGNYKTIAHHVSYDLPLDVTWLCQKHHKELHGNIPM